MHADSRYTNGERGFSLVELLVVIAIISALTVIGMLSYDSMRSKWDAERVIKELYTDLTNARVRSMERNRVHFVVFGVNQYAVYEDTSTAPDGDGSLNTATDATVLNKTINPRYPLTWPGAPGAWTAGPFQFNSKGMVPSELVPAGGNFVRIDADFGSEYDCVAISEIKISMGKWDGTSQCVSR